MKVKALVIDDSGVMRKMVMAGLQSTGLAEFEFMEAADGQDGLAKYNATPFDMIFVDWNMPNMTGIEFITKIRATKQGAYVPIIIITSENTMGHVNDANSQHVDAFVAKPFNEELLRRKIGPIFQTLPQRRELAAKASAKSAGFFGRLMGGAS